MKDENIFATKQSLIMVVNNYYHSIMIIMSPLTVVSLSEAQENMEVGQEVMVTTAVKYEKGVIAVVDKVLTNSKQ